MVQYYYSPSLTTDTNTAAVRYDSASSTLPHAGEWQCIHAQHCILAGCAGVLYSEMNHGQFWHLQGEIHFLIPFWVET